MVIVVNYCLLRHSKKGNSRFWFKIKHRLLQVTLINAKNTFNTESQKPRGGFF